jgi:glycine oxidase
MKKILIVGQGLAGSVLGWVLQQRGAAVHWADSDLDGAASTVAAGIINPVTGKRYVKSWEFDELFPAAQRIYAAMEADLGIKIWYQQDIVRLLRGAEEINNWSARCGQPDYKTFLTEPSDAGEWQPMIHDGFEAGRILQAGRVNFSAIKSVIRANAKQHQVFEAHNYTPDEQLEALKRFDCVICCQGWWAQEHPFFPDLPWQLAKGEALRVRLEHPDAQRIQSMLKRTHALVPFSDDSFWAGGTYEWDFEDAHPSASQAEILLHHLRDVINVPFKVLEHMAGVRPSVRTRRPILMASPSHPRLLMFNGLGTKGALLAPTMAEHMADYIMDGVPLPAFA